jgi:L-amino acid N-acyltransferase YncA
MVRVDAGTNAALEAVAENLRESDVREFLAISPLSTREDLADDLIARYRDRYDTFAAWLDHEPVAFGAMIETGPDTISAGFFATEAFREAAMPVAKFVRYRLFPAYAKIFRIECVIMEGYEMALRFARTLGFKEAGKLPAFGKDGENFVRFVWSG